MDGLFITGTDTDVGKTHVTAWLARHLRQPHSGKPLRVGAYKPVCSGAITDAESGNSVWSDIERLWDATGQQFSKSEICPQAFAAPLAPPVAAAAEGKPVDAGQLLAGFQAWETKVDLLLVEGVGGWKAPIADQMTVSDLAQQLALPVLIVAANRLGMLNHTLLTIESVQRSGLPILGVIINEVSPDPDLSSASNLDQLQQRTDVPILGVFPNETVRPLQPDAALATIDWLQLIQT